MREHISNSQIGARIKYANKSPAAVKSHVSTIYPNVDSLKASTRPFHQAIFRVCENSNASTWFSSLRDSKDMTTFSTNYSRWHSQQTRTHTWLSIACPPYTGTWETKLHRTDLAIFRDRDDKIESYGDNAFFAFYRAIAVVLALRHRIAPTIVAPVSPIRSWHRKRQDCDKDGMEDNTRPEHCVLTATND